MECKRIHVGDKVKVNENSDYYHDWRGEVVEVIGINKYPGKTTLDYTLDDGTAAGCDGWQESELTKIPQETTEREGS